VTEYKSKLDELRRAKATTVVKLEKEYVNTSVPGFVLFFLFLIKINEFIHSLNRPEKTKACEKCDEFEKILDTERKSNAQLKRLIEQKENSKQSTTGPCTKCSDLKNLLDIEKQNNLQLTEQLKLEKKRTEEERNAKEVFLLNMIFYFLLRFVSIGTRSNIRNGSNRIRRSKKFNRSIAY
jgi:hypothetical protein